MAAALGLCNICGGEDLHAGDDGFFYCSACGSLSQQFQEEALEEFDAHFVGAIKRANRPRQSSPGELGSVYGKMANSGNSVGNENDEEALAENIRKCYVDGLQTILQLQCEALVQKFGVCSLICGIVGPIWLRFLASSRVFQNEWATEALEVEEIRNGQRRTKQFKKGGENVVNPSIQCKKTRRKKESSSGPRSSKHSVVWLAVLKERIPLAITLAVLFLACHVAREPVLPTDIIEWSLGGTLPYLTAASDITKHSPCQSLPFPIDPRIMFTPRHIVTAKKLEFMSATVANRVGLRLPPVNFHAISCRLLRQLRLPVDRLSKYVCRFFDWYTPSGLWLSDQIGAIPSRVYVMAAVMIVLKVLYSVHGLGYWEKSVASYQEYYKKCHSTPCSSKFGKGTHEEIYLSTSRPQDNFEKVEKSIGDFTQHEVLGMEAEGACSGKHFQDRANSPTRLHLQKQKNLKAEKEWEKGDCSSLQNNCQQSNVWDGQSMLEELEQCRLDNKSQCSDYELDLPTYLKYCRDTIFSGQSMSSEGENLCDHLWELYEKDHADMGIKDTAGRTFIEPSKLHMPSTPGAREDSDVSSAILKGIAENACCDMAAKMSDRHSESRTIETLLNDSKEGNESLLRKSSRELPVDSHQSRLIVDIFHDLEESGFSYLPPHEGLIPPDGYVRYIRKSAKGGSPRRFVHADYFVLLHACAEVINVEPTALHWCIQRLEKGLKLIEAKVEGVVKTEVQRMEGIKES
eukprot:c29230_g1_i4 orf=84-2312(+)